MSKSNLKRKINCVKWSAVIFAIGYFLLGAYLTSTGAEFDAKKTYDLITTSLTLTAYFLAPVAAFVLFSDWREQHNAIKNEKTSEEVLRVINEDFKVFYTLLKNDLKDPLIYNKYRLKFYELITNLTIQVSNIREFDSNSREFKNNSKLVMVDLHRLWDNLVQQVFASNQFESIALNNDMFSKYQQNILIEMLRDKFIENQKIYEDIQFKIKTIKPLNV